MCYETEASPWNTIFNGPIVPPSSVKEALRKISGMQDTEWADFLVYGVCSNLAHRHDCTSYLHLENAEKRDELAWALQVILREARKSRYIQDDSRQEAP